MEERLCRAIKCVKQYGRTKGIRDCDAEEILPASHKVLEENFNDDPSTWMLGPVHLAARNQPHLFEPKWEDKTDKEWAQPVHPPAVSP